MKPFGHTAVMASRTEAPDSLDFFPTPPWATRAFLPILHELDPDFASARVWEPACGQGHMSAVLEEAAGEVFSTDVFDYGYGWSRDFLDPPQTPDAFGAPKEIRIDWVITNPPFKTAADFAERGLGLARRGVALLVRTAWLEGGDRFNRLFKPNPPRMVVQYAERVPMTKGRWDPTASTATAYCWVVWTCGDLASKGPTQFRWIEPGQKARLTLPADISRFAVRREAPLLSGDAA